MVIMLPWGSLRMARIQFSESCVQGGLTDSRHLGQDYEVEKVEGIVFGTPELLGLLLWRLTLVLVRH